MKEQQKELFKAGDYLLNESLNNIRAVSEFVADIAARASIGSKETTKLKDEFKQRVLKHVANAIDDGFRSVKVKVKP